MNLKEKIEAEKNNISIMERLLKKYPDLKEKRDRWGKIRYSANINHLCTDVHTHHSCGCCDDAVLYARPYLIDEGIYIYSEPEYFCIGEKDPSTYDDFLYPN